MHGQQLDGLVVHLRRCGIQTVFLGRRGFQPCKERQDVDPLGGVQEPGRGVLEGVQVAAGLMDADPGPRRNFDVQEHRPFDLAEQSGEVVAHVAAQLPELVREPLQAVPGLRAQPAAVRRGPAVAGQPVQGLDQAGGVRDVAFDHGVVRRLAVVRHPVRRRRRPAAGAAPTPGQETGPVPQGHQVRRADPPPRAGQQAHEGVRAARVGQDPERSDKVDDFRRVQQPAEPNDFIGNAPDFELAANAFHLCPPPAQDSHGRRSRVGGVRGVEVRHAKFQHVAGDRRGLGFVRGEPSHHHPAVHRGRAGLQRRDLDGVGAFPAAGGPRFAAALLSGAEMRLAVARMLRPLRHAVVR